MQTAPPLLFTGQLRNYAESRPDRPALADAHGAASYGELVAAIDGAASALAGLGVAGGDRVAVAMRPSLAHAAVLLGCLARGAVATSLNIRLTPTELAAYLSPIAPALLIADPDSAHLGEALGLRTLVLAAANESGTVGARLAPLQSDAAIAHEVAEDDDALIVPTGGTTGLPKGAVYTQRALWLWAAACAFDEGRMMDDHELYISPFFHSSIMSGWMSTLFAGGRVTILGAFSPAEVLRCIAGGATFLMGSPTALEGLLAHPDFARTDCSGVTKLRIATTSASRPLLERLFAAFPGARLQHTYGATEFGPVANIRHADFRAGRNAGVGTVRPSARVTIVGEDLKPLPVGETGEIVVDCPWRSRGYWASEEETRRTYLPIGVRSGDMGRLDADGWLTIGGRMKDIIVTGGENVFPKEVEDVLCRHPAVAQILVYGAADSYWGERIEAAVVLNEGAALSQADLIEYGRANLGGYKLPKRVRFVPEIPLTTMNKPDRMRLSREAAERGD